jgi:hypothetical protein
MTVLVLLAGEAEVAVADEYGEEERRIDVIISRDRAITS